MMTVGLRRPNAAARAAQGAGAGAVAWGRWSWRRGGVAPPARLTKFWGVEQLLDPLRYQATVHNILLLYL